MLAYALAGMQAPVCPIRVVTVDMPVRRDMAGVYGGTESATRAYQRSSSLTADGIVGPLTIGAALTDGFDVGFVEYGEPAGSTILAGAPTLRAAAPTTRFHRRAAGQLEALWAAWGRAGLLGRVRTYEGSYAARFVRGRPGQLSSHAYGSAFDINQRWNRLGHLPAPAGAAGSVRELVDIANAHGFFWGGHFKGRPDGMHFEVAKLL